MLTNRNTSKAPICWQLKSNDSQQPNTDILLPPSALLEETYHLEPSHPETKALQSLAKDANYKFTHLISMLVNSQKSADENIIDYTQLAQTLFIPISSLEQFINQYIIFIIELPINSAHDKVLRTNLITFAQHYYEFEKTHSNNLTKKRHGYCLQQQNYLQMLKALVFEDKSTILLIKQHFQRIVSKGYTKYTDLNQTEKAYYYFLDHYICQPLKKIQAHTADKDIREISTKIKRSIETIGKLFKEVDPAINKLAENISKWVDDPHGSLSAKKLVALNGAMNTVLKSQTDLREKCMAALLGQNGNHSFRSKERTLPLLKFNFFNIEMWATELQKSGPSIPLRQEIHDNVQEAIETLVYSPLERIAVTEPSLCLTLLADKFNEKLAKIPKTPITKCSAIVYGSNNRTPQEHKRITQEEELMRSDEKAIHGCSDDDQSTWHFEALTFK